MFFIDVEHDSSARGAVQNNKVCGILCDYKQIYSYNEGSYALLLSNIENTRIIVWDIRRLPL